MKQPGTRSPVALSFPPTSKIKPEIPERYFGRAAKVSQDELNVANSSFFFFDFIHLLNVANLKNVPN